MVGDLIKYEPAWILNKTEKEFIKTAKMQDCIRSPNGMFPNTLRQVTENLKKVKTVRNNQQYMIT